jgi:hypothetical protein
MKVDVCIVRLCNPCKGYNSITIVASEAGSIHWAIKKPEAVAVLT